jgi:hypothetical protein
LIGLHAFVAFDGEKRDPIALLKGFEALALYGAEVEEEVRGAIIGGDGVNSKKPPHYSAKFEKPLFFSEITKNHQYCVGCCNVQ